MKSVYRRTDRQTDMARLSSLSILIMPIQGVRAKLAYIQGGDRGGPDEQNILWEGNLKSIPGELRRRESNLQ